MELAEYKLLFTIFLIITIVLFILLIIFFFVFDIRKILLIKTGWAVKQSVKELNEINQNEDNKKRKKYKGHSIQLSKKTNHITEDIKSGNLPEPVQTATVTAKLEQEAKATMPLELHKEKETSIIPPELPEKKELKEGEIFNIVETKIIVFSNEVI